MAWVSHDSDPSSKLLNCIYCVILDNYYSCNFVVTLKLLCMLRGKQTSLRLTDIMVEAA